MDDPLYQGMCLHLTDYERTIARALKVYTPNWWQANIHPQTMLDYLNARDDANRIRAMATMARDAINHACMAFNAIAATEKQG